MVPVTWFRGKRGPTALPSAWRYAGPASDTSSGSTSLTAAATRASTTSIKRNKPADWWTEAWSMYDQVGELRYVSNAIAGRISQARLYIEKDGVEVEGDDEILNLITGQMVERMGLNLFVAGAVWLIGRPDPETDEQVWKVYSTVEVKTQGSGTAKIEDEQYVIEDIYMELITDPHPADWAQVDSPVRSALPVLRELVGLTQHVSAQVDSRLSGAGVYWIPNSILANPTVPLVRDAQTQTFSDNPVLNAVMSAMLLPIEDRSNASAIVPLLMGAPDEAISKIRYDTFATPFDRNTQALREEAIRRLALCLDSPPELLLGTSDQNHWCRPVGTLAYTRQGWAVPEIGEEILTAGGWAPVTALYRADATGDLGLRLTLSNTHGGPHTYQLTATEGHRFLVERAGERLLTTEPRPGDTIFRGLAHDVPETPVFSDALVQFLALYSSDGTWTRQNQIRLTKKAEWPFMEQVLTDLWGPAQASTAGDKACWVLDEVRGNGVHVARLSARARDQVLNLVPTKDKAVPLAVVRQFTAPQLALFLDAWNHGDGTGRNVLEVSQRDPARLDAPEYAAVLLGYGVRRTARHQESGFSAGGMHRLLVTREQVVVRGVETVTLDGEVWCPTTVTGTWLALDPDSGWSDYTGNSAWLVRDEVVQAHIVPRLDLICDALTTGFYRPMRAQVNPGEDVSVYEVKADVSVLVQRPNRLADASTLHAAHVIGDAALREAGGFGDEDAPTTLDTAIRLTLETALGNPQLLDNMSEVFANIAALLDGTPLTGPNQEEEPPAAPVRALRPVQQSKEVSVADVDTLPAAGPPV